MTLEFPCDPATVVGVAQAFWRRAWSDHPQMRILLAVEPVDFRRGIDSLAALCRQALGSDPQTGALFVFRSRRGHAIQVPDL
ncbi:MAG: IS66 family insertion sequence element accessory protein TnpB [Verrucomicrobiales bacterium]|nr:IS66 family insertion sequence element accessory protein TnpB [Verrucomicrobiales bacterium]